MLAFPKQQLVITTTTRPRNANAGSEKRVFM
jgi:hypothetical protein